jgi:hypothetical protein
VKYLEENAAAAGIRLDPADVAEIASALPPAVGERYPERAMASVRR